MLGNNFLNNRQEVWDTKNFIYETGKNTAIGAIGGAASYIIDEVSGKHDDKKKLTSMYNFKILIF
ncbi:hypothetical protein [Streptobacillus notomytis]|uniref:hypothetical protein n=1 Tax=Streptobacillus notomytis TaxID=1712031 RepID=UPI00093571A9|nr:hypothetical protein [Streptobacillus notomytis]